MTGKSGKYPLWRRLVKIVLWTAMAAVLVVWGLLVCCVNVLKPDNLTRITEHVANRMLDADVSIGRVELRLRQSFPFLTVDVESLTVVSRQMKRLPEADRERLPAYADTILQLDRFSGGINLMTLAVNEIALSDVTFERPGVNLAVLDERVNNYTVYVAADTVAGTEEADTAMTMPRISINRFRLVEPRPIRYYDASTGQDVCVRLSNVDVDGTGAPAYALSVAGSLTSPLLSMLGSDSAGFGFDGRIIWEPERPGQLAVNDMILSAAFVTARGDVALTMSPALAVTGLDVALDPVALERLVALVPDSMMRSWGLVGPFSSDISLALSAKLTAPFNLETDSVPCADVRLAVSPGRLYCGKMRFERLGGDFAARLKGNDIDKAEVTASNFVIAGPATNLNINCSVSHLLTDPLLDLKLRGRSDLQKLPPVLTRLCGGEISGVVKADIELKGRPSMFSRNRFHLLHVTGDIDADELCYATADTLNRFYLNSACFEFGTNQSFTAGEHSVDSLLSASIKIDSAAVSTPDLTAMLTGMRFGVGASNKALTSDTTAIIPMGAGLRVASVRVRIPSDSTYMRARNLGGRVSLRRFEGDVHRPEMRLDLTSERLSMRDRSTRFVLRNAEIGASMAKLERKPRRVPEAVRRVADSIAALHPELPQDSVYRLAFEQRRRSGARLTAAQEAEIIDWGTSKAFRRLLLQWDLRGSVKASRARMSTPYFPLRTRVSHFDLAFNNDSVTLDSVKVKAGRSDFLVSGQITNMKRGFTSRGYRAPIKIGLSLSSDTIDINQLADATFTGAAYSDAAAGAGAYSGDDDFDDDALDRDVDRYAEAVSDTLAALLIPTNVEGTVRMKARNIIYSDLLLHDFRGSMMLYDGAVNLNRLAASSEIGSIEMSALYSAPKLDEIKFGFGMQVAGFRIDRFMGLMPALDSVMPIMRDFSGIIGADIAATVDIDRNMDLVFPTLDAVLHLQGDSLTVIDPETFKVISKWLMFKDKDRNIIDHMDVRLTVHDNVMRLYPFIFDFDRYRLGVQGSNDLAMNFDYHVAVLKSPLPFKFGLNITGNADDFKVRLGKARLNEKTVIERDVVVDTARVNLVRQIENVFRRGVRNAKFATLDAARLRPAMSVADMATDTISRADSLVFIREGLIEAPAATESEGNDAAPAQKAQKRGRRSKSPAPKADALTTQSNGKEEK